MLRFQTLSPGSTLISESPSAPRVRRLFPEPVALRAEEIYHDLSFPEPPSERPYTAINMVSTADGRITVRGRAGGIGGRVDRIAMRVLRSRVDAVMVGAGTVRNEKINLGLPQDLLRLVRERDPLGVVISSGGDLPLQNLIQNEDERLLFLISEQASEGAAERLSGRGEVRRLPEGSGDRGPSHAAVLSLLREEYGIRRLLVEGGPSVNHALVEARLVDELFLTFAPSLAGGVSPGVASTILSGTAFEEPTEMGLLSAYESGSELYLRYSLEARSDREVR